MTTLSSLEGRAMRRDLAGAGDGPLLRVVQLVESLEQRGEADALLAPLRDRLRHLRPARRGRLTRLLFQPCDPVIVAASDWRKGQARLPRSALLPLAGLVRTSLGPAAADFDARVEGTDTTDAAAMARIGAQLWPRAAAALDRAEPPDAWIEQGLPAAEFAPLRDATAFIWAMQGRLVDLELSGCAPEIVEQRLLALLTAAEQRGAQCWGMLLALLLQRFPAAETPFRVAAQARPDPATARMAEAALTLATDWIEKAAALRGLPVLGQAATEIARQIALLDRCGREPNLRRRSLELRAALQESCLAQFATGLQACLDTRLAAPPDHPTLVALERDLRDLRRMETEARRLGNGAAYDQSLQQFARTVAITPGLERFERLRLAEILVGAAAAMKMQADPP